ncbi:AAA family ATPase [Bacillus halotolerans]|uniref:AAA family ATPase n=1 Tax=Bacillus halotolerans TaxID=260554 RepID=UPI003830D9B5
MRILSISFWDLKTKWNYQDITFDQLTLLVGVSGVGKTKIIKSIKTLTEIALGEKVPLPIKWKINFKIGDNEYLWSGRSKSNEVNTFNMRNQYLLEQEKLVYMSKDNEVVEVFSRQENETKFMGNIVPKTNSDVSLLSIFSEEEKIFKIISAFRNIHMFNFDYSMRKFVASMDSLDSEQHKKFLRMKEEEPDIVLKVMKSIDAPLVFKLAEASLYFPDVFKEIKLDFVDIFPRVDDIRIRMENEIQDDKKVVIYSVELKEVGTEQWVQQEDISAGMYKTLLFITLLKLTDEESVVIIDEFENSLGVNCIDEISAELIGEASRQFIITSHHPYIINNIAQDYWKIVTRNNVHVKAKSAKEYRLGESKHEAFKQLINLDAYLQGEEE